MERVKRSYLKEVRELLRDKKKRDLARLFVVEGSKIARDIIDKGYLPVSIIISDSYLKKDRSFAEYAEKKGVNSFHVSDRDFSRACTLKNPEGVFLVMSKPTSGTDLSNVSGKGPVLLLDNVQDPGNLGTMVRIAAAFGADEVLLYGDCADEFNPKTIRASAGAVVSTPVSRVDLDRIDNLKNRGIKLFAGTSASDAKSTLLEIANEKTFGVFAFGSEGRGFSEEILERADRVFHIPIENEVESLNVAAAAAITLYEIRKGS
ncbi:MAG: RNA methyltransferase [Candidatus Aadella gelida]|nr:RNA methyltransferase [Candidatus Aadella gelida]